MVDTIPQTRILSTFFLFFFFFPRRNAGGNVKVTYRAVSPLKHKGCFRFAPNVSRFEICRFNKNIRKKCFCDFCSTKSRWPSSRTWCCDKNIQWRCELKQEKKRENYIYINATFARYFLDGETKYSLSRVKKKNYFKYRQTDLFLFVTNLLRNRVARVASGGILRQKYLREKDAKQRYCTIFVRYSFSRVRLKYFFIIVAR